MTEQEEKKAPPRLAGPLETITLLDIADTMFELKEATQSMIEEGIVEPLNPRTVTTETIVVHPPHRGEGKLWFGVKMTNDGLSSVWVIVNTGKSSNVAQEIKLNETWGVKFNTAKIYDLSLYTESGTAVVRIRGSR